MLGTPPAIRRILRTRGRQASQDQQAALPHGATSSSEALSHDSSDSSEFLCSDPRLAEWRGRRKTVASSNAKDGGGFSGVLTSQENPTRGPVRPKQLDRHRPHPGPALSRPRFGPGETKQRGWPPGKERGGEIQREREERDHTVPGGGNSRHTQRKVVVVGLHSVGHCRAVCADELIRHVAPGSSLNGFVISFHSSLVCGWHLLRCVSA